MRFAKFIRNIVISVGVLLVLFVGAGVAYTWYAGQQSIENTSAMAVPVEATPAPTIKPRQPAPDAVMSAAVQSLTSPITAGSNASIIIKTNASANCTIVVMYDKVASVDSGLVPKVADEFGIATWTWTVEASVPLGTWPVKVICANLKNSAMVKGDLKVVKTIEQQA